MRQPKQASTYHFTMLCDREPFTRKWVEAGGRDNSARLQSLESPFAIAVQEPDPGLRPCVCCFLCP